MDGPTLLTEFLAWFDHYVKSIEFKRLFVMRIMFKMKMVIMVGDNDDGHGGDYDCVDDKDWL